MFIIYPRFVPFSICKGTQTLFSWCGSPWLGQRIENETTGQPAGPESLQCHSAEAYITATTSGESTGLAKGHMARAPWHKRARDPER